MTTKNKQHRHMKDAHLAEMHRNLEAQMGTVPDPVIAKLGELVDNRDSLASCTTSLGRAAQEVQTLTDQQKSLLTENERLYNEAVALIASLRAQAAGTGGGGTGGGTGGGAGGAGGGAAPAAHGKKV